MKSLRGEILHLQTSAKKTRVHLSTSLEGYAMLHVHGIL